VPTKRPYDRRSKKSAAFYCECVPWPGSFVFSVPMQKPLSYRVQKRCRICGRHYLIGYRLLNKDLSRKTTEPVVLDERDTPFNQVPREYSWKKIDTGPDTPPQELPD
jgi:hypothetical protein